jgi:hypothetical protein
LTAALLRLGVEGSEVHAGSVVPRERVEEAALGRESGEHPEVVADAKKLSVSLHVSRAISRFEQL